MSSVDEAERERAGARQDVHLALARAWLVAPMAKDPDLMCALALRTRDLQDGKAPDSVSPEVELSLDRYMDRRHPVNITPVAVWTVAAGNLVCSRDVITGACGVAHFEAAVRVHNDVMFGVRSRELKPGGRYLFDYWKIEENVLQALCLAPDEPKCLLSGYQAHSPWPQMRSALHDWTVAHRNLI